MSKKNFFLKHFKPEMVLRHLLNSLFQNHLYYLKYVLCTGSHVLTAEEGIGVDDLPGLSHRFNVPQT